MEGGHGGGRDEARKGGEALAEHEAWVTANPLRERARVLDASGRIVTEKEGEREGVDWPLDVLQSLLGRVDLIIHNHPDGRSLSENDVIMAVALGAREVVAVTRTTRFRLRRLGTRWPSGAELDRVLSEETERLVDEMVAARSEGKIDEATIELLFHRVLWERVAGRFRDQIRYEAERRE